MHYLPIYYNLRKKKILVVGGGRTAAQKLKTLTRFTKNITVIAEEFQEAVKTFKVKFVRKRYFPGALKGHALVYACTDNRPLNRKIKNDAGRLKIPVNVVDDPVLCDFISPAVYSDKQFCVAVSTFGRNPAAAAKIRDRIRQTLPARTLKSMVGQKRRKRVRKR